MNLQNRDVLLKIIQLFSMALYSSIMMNESMLMLVQILLNCYQQWKRRSHVVYGDVDEWWWFKIQMVLMNDDDDTKLGWYWWLMMIQSDDDDWKWWWFVSLKGVTLNNS